MLQPSYKTFADAFTAAPVAKPTPVAANDNKPSKARAPRYRGTLPALRWLFDHDPALGRAVAEALPKATSPLDGATEITDTKHQIRPTEGELLQAASNGFRNFVRNGERYEGKGLRIERDGNNEWVHLGDLRFHRGRLQQWGETKKGKPLRPVDRITGQTKPKARSGGAYLNTKPTVRSPMQAVAYQRPFSGEPALPPMYDPLPGVETNRAILQAAYSNSPNATVTRCPTVIAKGASFIGSVSRSKGNASTAAVLTWEGPAEQKGEVLKVLEEVAARGTLRSIGERLGYQGGYADRAGKQALLDAGRALVAANDNQKKKVAA